MSATKILKQRPIQLSFLLTLLFFWAHWPTLLRTVQTWQSNPDYSHGFLVVPIALAIAYRRYQNQAGGTERQSAAASAMSASKSVSGDMTVAGLVLIAVASLLRIVAAHYYLMPLDAWSVPLWLGGAVLCFGGWPAFRLAAPAIAFLWFAAPLPERAQQLLSLPLQERATIGSAWILQSLRQPAVASGTTLLLGAEVFEVEHACSGLRMFFGSFAMATAFILLAATNRATSVLLICLAAPIAIFANIVRIVATALMFQYASTELARRFAHDFAGLIMVGIVFLSFGLVVHLLRRGEYAYHHDRERYLRWLPIWPVAVASMAIMLSVWHHRQQDYVNGALLDAATAHEASGNWKRATGYLRRYLQLNSNDSDALRRLGNALNRNARRIPDKRRALTVMTAAWKANPADLLFAIQQAELAMELRRFNQAVDTTEAILADERIDETSNAEIRQLAARWRAIAMYESLVQVGEYAPYGWRDVSQSLDFAIRRDSHYPQHAFRRAIVLRDHLKSPSEDERNQMADKVVDALVNENADSAEAWLVRYRYRRRYHANENASAEQIADIDADLNQSIQLDAQSPRRNVHILVAAAERAQERGNIEASLSYYELARLANAEDVRPYLAIAAIWVDRNTPDARQQAVNVLLEGLEKIGDIEVPLLLPLIEQLTVLGKTGEADAVAETTERAIESFPEPVRTSYKVQLQHVRSWRLAKRGEFAAAADGLSSRLESLSSTYQRAATNYLAQSWANTAQYYRMAGDWTRVADCYQRAAALDDNWRMEYRWALAHQTESEGDLNSAVKSYRDLAITEATLDAWLDVATAALRQQVMLPSALRNWKQFQRAIDSAKSVAEDRMDEVIALEVNQWLVLGQTERVVQSLADGLRENPDSRLLHRSLAMVKTKLADFAGALEVAQQMPSDFGDPTESVLLQKEILIMQSRFDDAVALLQSAIEAEGPKQRTELQLEIASLQMQQGNWTAAKAAIDQAAETDPNHIRVVEALSQFAWCVQDWELLERCEASLRLMEGSYGPLWRTFRIRRILAQANRSETDVSDNGETTVEADDLARQLEALYPRMQQTRIAAGRVASYRGLLWKAVANYEEAWELGLPRVSLAVDLVGLLNELGETKRAQRYVQEVRRYLAASRNVIDDSLLERAHESADEAIRLAEALVSQYPRSDSYLRLGRTLVLTALVGRPDYQARLDRAETAFRRAVEIDPANTRTWAALFRYLVSVRPDPIESQSLLNQLAENEQISELNRKFAVAQLNESIGNRTAADRAYKVAIELAKTQAASGERIVVLERAAQYFRNHEPSVSESCCREALALDPNSLGPQRILLNLLLEKHSIAAAEEAERMIDAIDEQWLATDPGRRLAADVWLQAAKLENKVAGSRERRAIETLERITNKNSDDALRLAELRLRSGDRGSAIADLVRVAESLPQDGDRVLTFLQTYDHDLYADTRSRLLADNLYDRLEERSDFSLAALDARIDTTLTRLRSTSFSERQNETSLVINRYIRRMVNLSVSDHEKMQAVVTSMRHLVETGRWEFAENLTQLTPDLLPTPRTASALATALAMCDGRMPEVKALASQLDRWLADYPGDSELTFAIGTLNLMMGEPARAKALYEQCLSRNPNHAMLRNNLALALAMKDTSAGDRSMQFVEEAIELGGRAPEFLDTLAVLHLLTGENQMAVDLLLESLRSDTTSGVQFLHLARAWANLEETGLARYALNMAESRDVADEVRLPFDRQLYEELTVQLQE